MAIEIQLQPADINASLCLLRKMFTKEESDLAHLIYGTTLPPYPQIFDDPQDPFTKELLNALNKTMVSLTTHVTIEELRLNPGQVEQLQIQDPRIATLKQRVKNAIAKMPIVIYLRQDRLKVIHSSYC